MAIISTFSDSSSINTEANEQTLVTATGGTALNFIMSGSTTNGGNQSVILAGLIYGQMSDLGSAAQRDQVIILSTGFVSSIVLSGSGNAVTNGGSISTDFYSSAVSFSNAFGIFTVNEVNRVGNTGLLATTALSSSTYTVEVAAANTAKTYITNSGTILSNAGKAISLGDASDVVRNTGAIFGDVKLGGGFNFLDSTTGSIHGNIFAGDGGNTIKASNVGGGVTTGSGIDLIWGGTGNDFIDAGGSNDRIHGGDGDDIIIGGAGDDKMYGEADDDSLDGGIGADLAVGGAGDDRYYVDNFGDIVNEYSQGGAGHDVITVEGDFNFSLSDTFRVKGLVEDLVLEGVTGSENLKGTGNSLDNLIVGNNGNNVLVGLGGDDELHGGDGNDSLIGGDGIDTLFGGNGDDTYFYDGDEFIDESGTTGRDTVRSFVDIDLTDQLVDEDDNETPYFEGSIEVIELGPSGNLNAAGDILDNTLNGNSFHNRLSGRGGIDFHNGYGGNDTLTGGADNDRFYFNSALNAANNVDTITDMVHLADKIYIDDAIFKGTFNTGLTLNSGLFRLTAAGDANDRIIYNKTTGELFYDGNGSAAGGSVKFAVLTTKPTLTAADFVVF